MNISIVIVSSLLGVLTAACASQAGGSPPPKSQPPPPAAMAGPLERAVNAARADAARRTGVAAESRALISAEGVTWSDGSLYLLRFFDGVFGQALWCLLLIPGTFFT